MNRFKFRVWDKIFNKFVAQEEGLLISPDFKTFVLGWDCAITGRGDWEDRFVFQQYTGIKDKNGFPVYEGDWAKICLNGDPEDPEWEIGKIYWDEEKLAWGYDGPECYGEFLCEFRKATKNGDYLDLEVMGNIYEQPRLLSK